MPNKLVFELLYLVEFTAGEAKSSVVMFLFRDDVEVDMIGLVYEAVNVSYGELTVLNLAVLYKLLSLWKWPGACWRYSLGLK